MIAFYLMALIPAIIGCILFMLNKKINWQEWLGGTAIAFLVSGIMHGIAFWGMTDDAETWSGKITHASHFPRWVEQYEESHTRTYTTGSGKNMRTHTTTYYTTEHATHSEHWIAYLSFGEISEEKDISLQLFNEIKKNFGGVIENGGKQSNSHGGHFDGGDNNIYLAPNKTGYMYPATTLRRFENRIKAAPTVFSFVKVPTNVPVYEWPENPNWMVSDRLIGESRISILEFDRMNARLGPSKFVNVIMINFWNKDREIAEYQRAKFIGGKKNDIIICYGGIGTNGIASWSMAFGWSESEICKRNLETIILSNPINNDILPIIEKEIMVGYKIKDWTKFDYISINPPTWSYIVLIVVMLLTQGGFWLWANYNEFTKDRPETFY